MIPDRDTFARSLPRSDAATDLPDFLAVLDLPSQDIAVKSSTPGELLLNECEEPSRLCIVLSGLAYGFRTSAQGRREICGLYLPGDMPNLGSLYSATDGCTVRALTHATAAFIAWDRIQAHLCEDPAAMSLLLRAALNEAAVLREWYVSLASRNTDARMAHFICEVYMRLDTKGLTTPAPDRIDVPFPFTQVLLSEMTGMSIVQANRTLKRLRDSGMVSLRKNWISVRDFPGLLSVAGLEKG